MTRAVEARADLRDYVDAQDRANRAGLGTSGYGQAMADVRRLHAALQAFGIEPNTSWRESTKRTLRLPVKARRPAGGDAPR